MDKAKEVAAIAPTPTEAQILEADRMKHNHWQDLIINSGIGLIGLLIIGILVSTWLDGMIGLKICITALVFIASDIGAFFMNRTILIQINKDIEKSKVQ